MKYTIDKKEIEQSIKWWKNHDLNNGSNLDCLILLQQIHAAIRPLEEQQCTKCNGTGISGEIQGMTVYCHHCNGTGVEPKGCNCVGIGNKCRICGMETPETKRDLCGVCHELHCKEPRKEELCIDEFSYNIVKDKLTIAIEAFERILEHFSLGAVDAREMQDIARTALEKLKGKQEEKCECHDPEKYGHWKCCESQISGL